MSMLAKALELLKNGGAKLAGRTDLLEAVCAASALVAAADGDISDDEVESAVNSLKASKTLSAAFRPQEIESALDTALSRAGGGRVGKLALKKELNDIKSRDDAEIVLCAALEVAEASGSIDAKEKAVLEDIAGRLGLRLSDYL